MMINGRSRRFFWLALVSQLIVFLGMQSQALAQYQSSASYPDFYSISQVGKSSISESQFLSLLSTVESFANSLGFREASSFNLLKWDRAGRPLPVPTEAYNRAKHFGTWIDDGRDNNCLDTRGKILARTSRIPVTYTNAKKCFVATGEWLDPYTNRIFRSAADIQIDHFIPLKQAYTTGAWTWNRKIRCLYSNYLFNEIQLLAVNGLQNQIKSDHAPNEYMPPNKQIWCAYLANWLKVKMIWNLVMTPPEAKGVADIFTAAKCNANDFQLTMTEMQKQRTMINANALYCDYDVGHKPNGLKIEN